MGARGNKLSSCKIPDQYVKNQTNFRTLETLADEKRIVNTIVLLTLKIINCILNNLTMYKKVLWTKCIYQRLLFPTNLAVFIVLK